MRNRQESFSDRGGEREQDSFHDRAWLDSVIALVLLTLSLPLLLLASLLPKLADGGPVLWGGKRLGKDRRPFAMYKIRSLALGAEELIGARPMTPTMAAELPLEHRFGRFLRESHVDELPQFINVLKGDMQLIGPRPVRREVYEAECRNIEGYDRRFMVKPGVFGYSQVLTPHNSSKKIRKKLDNHFIALAPPQWRKLLFLLNVLIVLIARLPVELVRALRQSRSSEHRRFYRVAQSSCRLRFVDDPAVRGVVTDVSDDAMSVQMAQDLMRTDAVVRIEVSVLQWRRLRRKRKVAYCRVLQPERRPSKKGEYPFSYVVRYRPLSAHNDYLIQKYFLGRSLL